MSKVVAVTELVASNGFGTGQDLVWLDCGHAAQELLDREDDNTSLVGAEYNCTVAECRP